MKLLNLIANENGEFHTRKETSLALYCQLDKGAAASCRQLSVHIDPAASPRHSSDACWTSLLTGTPYTLGL